MDSENQGAHWRDIAKASFFGVGAAWLAYAVISSATSISGPSNDIAMAMLPAALLISLLVAALLFWPLTMGMARLGTNLARSHRWANQWWAWGGIGAIVGAATLVAFITLLIGGSSDFGPVSAVGAAAGAIAALITYWRLRVAGRFA